MSHRDDPLLAGLRGLVEAAGQATLAIYRRGDVDVRTKGDESPLTEADLESQRILVSGLREFEPAVPVIAEESAPPPWSERRTWERAFLVDPLDGTREFIRKQGEGGRGEFTVNVALVESGSPVAGAVCAPVLGRTWLGRVGSGRDGSGAWRVDHAAELDPDGDVEEVAISVVAPPEPDRPRVVASRSHRSDGVDAFLAELGDHELVSMGSSLKLCILAEGGADLYPRLGRTMEWDIAAGHAVLRAAGGHVLDAAETPLRYNKEDLANPDFLALGAASPQTWRRAWREVA